MHESHITEEMLKVALKRAEEEGIQKITRIGLALGNKGHLSPEPIRMHFEAASKNTPAEGAELSFRPVEDSDDLFFESIEGE